MFINFKVRTSLSMKILARRQFKLARNYGKRLKHSETGER